MFRLLVFLLKIVLLVGIFLFLRATTGTTSIEWGAWHIELHTSLLVVGLLFLLILSTSLASLWFSFRRFLDKRHHLTAQKKSRLVLDDLLLAKEHHLKGLDNTHLLSTDKNPAHTPAHPYVTLVHAEFALQKGALTQAENLFSSLLSSTDSTLSARIGLLNVAKERNLPHEVFKWGHEALLIAPTSPFVHETLLTTCQNSPELSETYARDIAPLLKHHILNKNENIRTLYAEWLMDRSRQKTLEGHLVKKDRKIAISLANKAFALHPTSLTFERMIRSLVENETTHHLKKAGKLIVTHWSSYASLSLAKIYRDTILASKAPHLRIQALRQLTTPHHSQKDDTKIIGHIALIETLIINGMRGEASALIKTLEKDYPHRYEDVLASLKTQTGTTTPQNTTLKNPSLSPTLPSPLTPPLTPPLPPDVPLRPSSKKP